MYYDAISVEPKDDYLLYIKFQDGKKGFFDVKPYLDFGVFNELKQQAYFKQVRVLFGALIWPNGQDISPKKLYDESSSVMPLVSNIESSFVAPKTNNLLRSYAKGKKKQNFDRDDAYT
jgi:hypothetical protein